MPKIPIELVAQEKRGSVSMKFKLAIAVLTIVAIIGVIIMAAYPNNHGWIGFLMLVIGILGGDAAFFCWLDWDYYRRHSEDDNNND